MLGSGSALLLGGVGGRAAGRFGDAAGFGAAGLFGSGFGGAGRFAGGGAGAVFTDGAADGWPGAGFADAAVPDFGGGAIFTGAAFRAAGGWIWRI